MILASKSKDNSSITLNNGIQFIVLSEDVPIVENWSVGTEIEVHTTDSTIPYNHVITNPSRQEKIRVGIPK